MGREHRAANTQTTRVPILFQTLQLVRKRSYRKLGKTPSTEQKGLGETVDRQTVRHL